MEIRIVRPDVHGKLELTDEAGTTYEGRNSPLYIVVGCTLGQCGAVSSPASNHLSTVHVFGTISRIHPPNVGTQRAAVAMRVHGSVTEVIVAAVISSKLGVILVRSENKRSTTSPTSH